MTNTDEQERLIYEAMCIWHKHESHEHSLSLTILKALEGAGHLITPEQRELCTATSDYPWVLGPTKWTTRAGQRFAAALCAYRTTLKPKPRWTVRQSVISSSGWVIEDGITLGHNLGGLTEDQARAGADVLNALEER